MLDRGLPDGAKRDRLCGPLLAHADVTQTRSRSVRTLPAHQRACPIAPDLAHSRFIRFIRQDVLMRKFPRHGHLIPIVSKSAGDAFADIESQSDVRFFPLTSPDAMMQQSGGAIARRQGRSYHTSTDLFKSERKPARWRQALSRIARGRTPAAARALLEASPYPNGGVCAKSPASSSE